MDSLAKKLFKAAKRNDTDKVKWLIQERGISTTTMNMRARTVGHFAVRNANFDMLKYVVDKNPSILKIKDDHLYNIFHLAVKRGALDMVKYLVEKFNEDILQVFKPDTDETGTALHRAVKFGHAKIVKYFIEERGVNPNGLLERHQNQPPLFLAVKYKHSNIVKYLVEEKNADLTLVDIIQENILFQAVRNDDLNLVKYFLDEKKAKLDINWRNVDGSTLLHKTIELYERSLSESKFEILKYLVEQKHADVNIRDRRDETAFFRAGRAGQLDTIKYLLEHGADVNTTNKYGACILSYETTSEDMCRVLTKHGANVNHVDVLGKNLLYEAIEGDHEYGKCVCLLDGGADWNQAPYGLSRTPLDLAFKLGRTKLMKYFVNNMKIDLNTPNQEGRTPLHRAAQGARDFATCHDLIAYGADINRQDKSGNTALHYAALANNDMLCKFFVKQGADILLKNTNGETAAQSTNLKSLRKFLEDAASKRGRRSVDNSPAAIPVNRTLYKFEEERIDGGAFHHVGYANEGTTAMGTPIATDEVLVSPLQNFFLLARVLFRNVMNSSRSQEIGQFAYLAGVHSREVDLMVVEDAIEALPSLEEVM